MANNVIYCAFCVGLYKGSLHEEHEAITIANGHATCEEHLKYISHHDGNHANILRFMNRKMQADKVGNNGTGSRNYT